MESILSPSSPNTAAAVAAFLPARASTAALRIRLYGPSCVVLSLMSRLTIAAGVSHVEEAEEPLDPTLALACARLGSLDSREYGGVGGDSAPFVCLGGFRNTRGVYELEDGGGLVLELDETRFDFGTTYELVYGRLRGSAVHGLLRCFATDCCRAAPSVPPWWCS